MKFGNLLSLINFLLQLCQNLAIFPGNIANHYYLNKQRFLLEILHHVQEPLLQEQWIALGQQIVSDKTEYVHYNDHMRQFYQLLGTGRLLPKDIYYNPNYAEHKQQTLGLYNFFYNTREWSTLRQNICWARLHLNSGLFLHALMQTLLKREDYRALIVPKIYELVPAPYQSETVIREANKFNYANWILHGNETCVELVQAQSLLPPVLSGDLRSTSKWSEAMTEVEILSLKQEKGTVGVEILTEDVGWLSYWYYINMGLALQENETEAERVQDWNYFQLNQLVARYKLERYGQRMAYRHLSALEENQKNYLLTWQYQRYQLAEKSTSRYLSRLLKQLNENLEEAFDSQHYRLSNGTIINLRQAENWLLGLAALFPYDLSQLSMPIAKQPQAILELHTMLRLTKFYYYADRILHAYKSYRTVFQPCYPQPLMPSELRFHKVQTSPLITFDEPVDIDLSNILNTRHFYYEDQFVWSHTLQARKFRLQQRPFKISFHLFSNKTQSIILRSYLTTASGSLTEEPFYQLDTFLTILYAGNNTIIRESRDFYGTVGDHISYTELYQYVRLAERDQYDFPLNISTPNCGFPRRLILPKGSTNGLPMRLFIIATPYKYKAREGNQLNCDFSHGVSTWDELSLGFPFEKHVEEDDFIGSHTYWQTVEILHENRQ